MKKILIVFLMFSVFGCAKKYVKQTGEEGVKSEEAVEETISPEGVPDVEASVIGETIFEFKDALFDFDKYNIRPDARKVLDTIAMWLDENKDVKVIIEGHCDERGTNEYNLALGERRAKSAKDYLISQGIARTRMSVITYGEEKQLCTEQEEDCWQSNRRAHFVVTN
jgi:peptidoglycan-associated lipoprotein